MRDEERIYPESIIPTFGAVEPGIGVHYRMHATFFRAALSGGPYGEAGHELLWLAPDARKRIFFHACHDRATRRAGTTSSEGYP
jgi:hypothetical protein